MEVRTLKNGTKQGKDGKFLPGVLPTTGIQKGDSTRAREMANKRWADARNAALVEVALLGDGVGEDAALRVWGRGVGAVMEGAIKLASKAPDRASKALAFAGQALGYAAPGEREGNRSMVAVQVIVSSAADAQVSRIAAAAGDVLEGELEA